MNAFHHLRTLSWLIAAVLLAITASHGATSVQAARPDVEVEKTASQSGNLVTGDITIINSGQSDATIDTIVDVLEVHFPGRTSPALPEGSTPNWYAVAEVPVDHPDVVPAGETLVLPYSFDLCDAADFAGASTLRNAVEVSVSDARGEKTARARSEGFRPTTPACDAPAPTSLWLSKVDQDGNPIEGVELQVTFPDGSVETCTTDASGMCHFEGVPEETYTVDEPAAPPGYVAGGCLPDDDSTAPGAQVTLEEGDQVTVTCTNVAQESCVGDQACEGVTGNVGAGSCIGFQACQGATGDIGNGSCNGAISCQALAVNVGDGSCLNDQACLNNTGDVGDGSCVGHSSCLTNSGNVGANSCVGNAACTFNSGDIGTGSCHGFLACGNNSAPIGDGQCLDDQVCQNNTTPMP